MLRKSVNHQDQGVEDLRWQQLERQRSVHNKRCWILSLRKTLKTSLITSTTRNWIINDLLKRQRITLSWEKTLKDHRLHDLSPHDQEKLECLRSAPQSLATKNRIRS